MPIDHSADAPSAQPGVQEKTGSSNLVIVSDILPDILSIVLLTERPVFPGIPMPLLFSGKKYIDAINQVLESPAQVIGAVLIKELNEERFFGRNYYGPRPLFTS